MKQLFAAVILTAAVLLTPSTSRAQVDGPPEIGQVSSIECPISVPDSIEVDCGALIVPENYADPAGSKVRLPYILLHSPDPDAAPDPLVYTAGGPGWSSLDSVWGFVNSPMLFDRDVIIFEQRGNRYAEPALICDSAFTSEEVPGNTPCLDSIRAKGVNISQYTTENIVRDIIALRQTLGYEQWNLLGGSYSTALMLLVMEADPGAVRSATLESIKPPNETVFAHEADAGLRAVQQMLTDCAADSRCAAAYPDLAAHFFDLVKELNASPVEVRVRAADGGEPLKVEVDGPKFIDWLVLDSFYRPAFPPFATAYLPLLIDEVGHGNLAPLRVAVQSFWSNTAENSQWSFGLMLAINCQQELPGAGSERTAADIAAGEVLDGFSRFAGQRAVCAAWNLPALPLPAAEYVQSDVPALVLAGSYDPVTPPAWSRAAADHLPNSTYVEFPGYGHNVTVNNPCAESLKAAFLKRPEAQLDLSCVEQASTPSFVLPEDLFIAPGLAESSHDVNLGSPQGKAWLEVLSVISLLGLVSLFIGLVTAGLLWLARRPKDKAPLDKSTYAAYLLALLVIVTALAIPVLVTRINNEYLGGNIIGYSLGPSRDFGPAVLLAWLAPLAGLFILALAVVTLWAWLARRWSLGFRLTSSLVVLFSLTIVMLGLRWGLFTMLI